MEDVILAGNYPGSRLGTSPPGYMRSTLRVPGPCARPLTQRPRSVSQSVRPSVLCPTCCRPVQSRRHSSPGERPYTPSMAQYEQMDRIAARFGIRGSNIPSGIPSLTNATINKKGVVVKPTQDASPPVFAGRMFVREKSDTTRGERDIIKGICKNRTPLTKSKSFEVSRELDRQNFTSHRDAWLAGYQTPRTINASGNFMAASGFTCRCESPYVLDVNSPGRAPRTTAVSNAHFVDFSQYSTQAPVYISPKLPQRNPHDLRGIPRDMSSSGEFAPKNGILHRRKQIKIPPINSRHGAIFISRADAGTQCPSHQDQSPKTTMDIYLPRLSLANDSESDVDASDAGDDNDSSLTADAYSDSVE